MEHEGEPHASPLGHPERVNSQLARVEKLNGGYDPWVGANGRSQPLMLDEDCDARLDQTSNGGDTGSKAKRGELISRIGEERPDVNHQQYSQDNGRKSTL